MDKRKNNGGHSTKGKAGRPPKIDEEKKNLLFVEAIKQITRSKDSDEAKIKYIKQLAGFERGMMFIAEHIFGKPKETIDANVQQTMINWIEEKTYPTNDNDRID